MDTLFDNFTTTVGGDLPTKTQYDAMVGSVMDAFPSVRGKLSLVDSMSMLKRMLRDKFRNKRAACKKRARSPSADDQGTPLNKRKRVAGLPHYQPDDTMGVVDLQIKINEMKTASATECQRLMEETFSGRRRMIMAGGASIKDIARDFPALCTPQGFRDEVDRLTGKTDYKQAAVEKFDQEMEGVACTLKSPEGQVLRQTAQLMGVQLHDVMLDEEDDRTAKSPYPVVRRGREIFADGVQLSTAESESDAVVGVVLAHSVLNLNFRKKVAPLMFFVQRYVLGVDDGTKAPQKCLKLVQQLDHRKAP